jgi:hypothetical protein
MGVVVFDRGNGIFDNFVFSDKGCQAKLDCEDKGSC